MVHSHAGSKVKNEVGWASFHWLPWGNPTARVDGKTLHTNVRAGNQPGQVLSPGGQYRLANSTTGGLRA